MSTATRYYTIIDVMRRLRTYRLRVKQSAGRDLRRNREVKPVERDAAADRLRPRLLVATRRKRFARHVGAALAQALLQERTDASADPARPIR